MDLGLYVAALWKYSFTNFNLCFTCNLERWTSTSCLKEWLDLFNSLFIGSNLNVANP